MTVYVLSIAKKGSKKKAASVELDAETMLELASAASDSCIAEDELRKLFVAADLLDEKEEDVRVRFDIVVAGHDRDARTEKAKELVENAMNKANLSISYLSVEEW